MARSRFFEATSSPIPEGIDTDILDRLTPIMLSGCPYSDINREFSEDDYDELAGVMSGFGEYFLRGRCLVRGTLESLPEARASLASMISGFISIAAKNKFAIVSYCAQLLQFYLMVSNKAFTTGFCVSQLHDFLRGSRHVMGNTGNNPFVVEYQLLKIYNQLGRLRETRHENTALIQEELVILTSALENLLPEIGKFTQQGPDYLFSHYLDYMINMTWAKAIELGAALSPMDKQYHTTRVEAYLANANRAMDTIKTLQSSCESRNASHQKGMEFCFGLDLFDRFQLNGLEEVAAHGTGYVVPGFN